MTIGNFAPVAVSTVAQAQPLADPVSTLTLHVQSAGDSNATFNANPDNTPIHKGDAINEFKYIINIDNTGTTDQKPDASGNVPVECTPADPAYPANCKWVSTAGRANHSPIYTQGDQSDFPGGVFTVDGLPVNLPDGRYLISVLADNYKIDGAHFSIPSDGSTVVVEMQPYDLPSATIQAAVFEDMAPTNSAPDLPAERGLAGFVGHIKDYIDEVTTDVYGDPLCGNSHCVSKCYVVDGGADLGYVNPMDAAGHCPFREELANNAQMTLLGGGNGTVPATATIEGKVIIPNVGPNRYALSVTPPDNSGWIQTTTLEGNHDWDAWVMEGATGLDTEFVLAGEPFPATFFGFVPPSFNKMATVPSGNVNRNNTITGTGLAVSAYIPPLGGLPAAEGVAGAKPRAVNPIHRLFVSLSNLNQSDQTVFVGEFPCNETAGCPAPTFTIPNVPDGDYVLGVWDEPQDYIFEVENVSVSNGTVVDMGPITMVGWWTTIEGHVFIDNNPENGKMDPGEVGVPNFFISMRMRENSVMDRGTVAVTTDANGYYWMESAYPMTQWLVEEAYADGFQTTGITYQADNQPTETTILGQGVDVNVHPVIGVSGRLDWGVKAYSKGTNGGIVGTVSYDTTRNELNPQYAAIEDWQPSISDLNVDLYAPVLCGTHANVPCDENGLYELAQDGSYALGQLLNQYVTETWERPSGCVARKLDGTPLASPQQVGSQLIGGDQQSLPLGADLDGNTLPCLEAPMQGVQFGPMADGVGTPDENFGATVDGNYGFGDGCFMPDGSTPGLFDPDTGACLNGSSLQSLPSNKDYLVKVEIPDDELGRPMYKVTREEDINIANGDSFVPQVPPPACAGALHTVDVAGILPDGPNATFNPTFVEIGGSVYEGQQKPLCDTKLVHLSERKSIAPGFNLFTDVPLPGRFWGLIVDDLNYSSNPKQLLYGEKMGIPFAPVGIYDYTNRLITTVESDYNGLFDVLLPSTNRISCPTPSGVCANLYRFVGNDPGIPGRLNLNFNPQYRTIAAEFEAFAGLTVPADLAPTQVALAIQIPGTQTLTPIACTPDAAQPQLFAVSRPYVSGTGASRQFTITGKGLGTSGQVTLDGTPVTATFGAVNALGISTINVTVPTTISVGPKQLKVTANGQSTINGLTVHVLGTGYNPQLFEVGPGKTYQPSESLPAVADHAIQNALDAAANFVANSNSNSNRGALVVVYPNNASADPRQNPRGAYYENLIITSKVKLQGVGPGSPDGSVRGSIIDGGAFGGDSPVSTDWYTKIDGLTWAGNQTIYDGADISIYVPNSGRNAFPTSYNPNTAPSIDGFELRGGNQQGFPNNIDPVTGQNGQPAGVITQGGAIFANSYARNLQITNNVVQNNGGAYGTLRIGTPNLPGADSDNQNDGIRIANNRILANGGTNLAGAIGLFHGADNYEIAGNDLCGNFSAEYGGGISVFGLQKNQNSVNNSIHDNRIYFNRSYDEGAGIMIAGELPADPNANYGTPNGAKGSGPVDIYNNLIQANLADDDGGGIRFLMAASDCANPGFQACAINVYNNMIVNNVSTHEGGGVALDDAPNVRIYNNTVMNNVTTATAITSDGQPAPAGLSTGPNSGILQAVLPGGSSLFSNPLLFNNIFWDNRAGTKDYTYGSVGIGVAGDNTAINNWDMGSIDPGITLSPTNSILQVVTADVNQGNSILSDPMVINGNYHIPLTFDFWRANTTNPIMMTADLPPTLMGNYHIQAGSPAINFGAASKSSVNAPARDYDGELRSAPVDSGADEHVAVAAAIASVSPTSLAFGNVFIGTPSTVQNLTLNNTGNAALTGINVVVTAPFARSGGTCAATLNAAATCTIGVVFTPTASGAATGSVTITANVAVTGSPVTLTGTGAAAPTLPTVAVLDNFNRGNANTLGGNWSQTIALANAGLRVNNNQAFCVNSGLAALLCVVPASGMWNVPAAGFGAKQGTGFTFANAPSSGAALILKASGGSAATPQSFIRVRYTGTQVIVETTTNSGGGFTTTGSFTATFATSDTFTAVANADGSVDVWKNSTFLGRSATSAFTSTGRIGMQLPSGARADDFRGATVP